MSRVISTHTFERAEIRDYLPGWLGFPEGVRPPQRLEKVWEFAGHFTRLTIRHYDE